jgi:hypothetical protein
MELKSLECWLQAIEQIWNDIQSDFLANFIDSMPVAFKCVYKRKEEELTIKFSRVLLFSIA